MRPTTLSVGYIPLIDAAPLIVAQEMGFAAEEGLSLDLRPAPSWSSVRDMLAFGRVDAAHMLSPVPVATALGLGGSGVQFAALSVLSMNGNVIGVPFPFSMHAELLYYWLSALGLPAPQSVDIRMVPPPLMGAAIEAGEIDAFCVGEPWGSQAVEHGGRELLLPGCAIWSAAPEKVLAVRSDWAEQEQALMGRLIRAVWRAAHGVFRSDLYRQALETTSADLPGVFETRGRIERADGGRVEGWAADS